MSTTRREIGIAQLTLLQSSPPELVSLAATAGFDFIGVRVRPVTAEERPYNVQPGSSMLTETLARMADTGVRVHDIEFLLLDGSDQRTAWLSMMEAGHALGAVSLTVAASDTDRSRLADTLAQMTADGQAYGIVPTLEPISYQAVNSLPNAAGLARTAGCQIVADTLHVRRFGGTPAELAQNADLIPLLQLCDGPAQRPADRTGLLTESRSERGVPGNGDFRLAELVAALPAGVPVSVETPSDSTVARIGELAWAQKLRSAAARVLEEALAFPTAPER